MSIDENSPVPTVAVAGASGFIGRSLCRRLSGSVRVVALSRSAPAEGVPDADGVLWKRCDLFSQRSCTQALEGADMAVYLVHSMMPSARLTQGSFEDLDLVLAGNFASAAKSAGIQRIVYVGGLAPDDDQLSAHLRSRLEVEEELEASGAAVASVRAGLVIGSGGSSFLIVKRLVERLPILICPSWTSSKMQPVSLGDIVEVLAGLLADSVPRRGPVDVGGADVVTYRELIEIASGSLGLRRRLFSVPYVAPSLSALWVSLVTSSSMSLVSPLVQSLTHDMVVRDTSAQSRYVKAPAGAREAFRQALADGPLAPPFQKRSAAERKSDIRSESCVRSVQRLPGRAWLEAADIAREYTKWLPRAMWPFIGVRSQDGIHRFRLRGLGLVLLELADAPDRSSRDRYLFLIKGGLLARTGGRTEGRFEFRCVLGGRATLAAIHDFRPRLPWLLYSLTQALAHRWVMFRFGRHLDRMLSVGGLARNA